MDVYIIFYVGSGLELKHMEKTKIEQAWNDYFSTCATGLRPALLLGGRDWRALPRGCECY